MRKLIKSYFCLKQWAVIALLGMVVVSCKKTDKAPDALLTKTGAPTQNLYAMVSGNSSLSIFTAALQRTRLDSLLKTTGPYTVIAPDDSAFQAAGLSLVKVQTMNLDSLKQLVGYHIVPGFYLSSSTKSYISYRVRNLDSALLFVEYGLQYVTADYQNPVFPEEYYVNGQLIAVADSQAVNGILDIAGGVLINHDYTNKSVLDVLSGDTTYSLFYYALQKSGLDARFLQPAALQYYTVFAPTNQAMINAGYTNHAAIDNQPADTLRFNMEYHILPASTAPLFYNDLLLATADFNANGTTYSTKPTLQGYGLLSTVTEIYAFAMNYALLIETDATRHITLMPYSIYNFGGNIYINYSDIANVAADPIRTSNGNVYSVDKVLVP